MKLIRNLIIIFIICVSLFCVANAENGSKYYGTSYVKDNMLFLNNNSIPAAQLPNEFVYLPVDMLEYHGFDVSLNEDSGKRVYTVTRNEEKGIFPSAITAEYYNKDLNYVNFFYTNAEVYIESDVPANAYELENGTVFIQCDELAKYGTFDWNGDTHTINIDYGKSMVYAQGLPFNNALGVDNIENIAYGTIVMPYEGRCADINAEDLKKFLEVYWNFYCDRVIAPFSEIDGTNFYIKLWNVDKTKSYTIYTGGGNDGIIVGAFGEACESHGELKQNYVWYKPYIGNARNALHTANTELYMKYLHKSYEGYTGNERIMTELDKNDKPENNILPVSGASEWAKPEIQAAAACNLMLYEFSGSYQRAITRKEFCYLIYRLIATEFSPESDSRMGEWSAVERIIDERGVREAVNKTSYKDCNDEKIKFMTAAGIIDGMGDGSFAPDEMLTREQAAKILHRTAIFLGNKTIPKRDGYVYTDNAQISYWAKEAVEAIRVMGIMKGVSETSFSPQGIYSVEQAIATMLRLYEAK